MLGKYLLSDNLFDRFMSQESQNKLINIMKEEIYSDQDIIYKENTPDDCSLYFILKGQVEIFVGEEHYIRTRGYQDFLQLWNT